MCAKNQVKKDSIRAHIESVVSNTFFFYCGSKNWKHFEQKHCKFCVRYQNK